jgi:glycolate oxidase
MSRLFTQNDLDVMERLRMAFNPTNRLSPHKMLPTAGACGIEQHHPGRRAAL